MKCLLVFIGACFRYGNSMEQKYGMQEAVPEQAEAFASHLRFIKKLKALSIECDTVVNTYSTQYDHKILDIYKPARHAFCTDLVGWINLYKGSVNLVNEIIDGYDFVHYIRIDLVLKSFFIDNFVLSDKIRYSSLCFIKNNYHKCISGSPRVADLLLFVPKEFFRLFTERHLIMAHQSFDTLLECNVPRDKIGCYTNTYHDSDSNKDWNPFYRIANRKETTEWYTNGFVYDFENDVHQVPADSFLFKYPPETEHTKDDVFECVLRTLVETPTVIYEVVKETPLVIQETKVVKETLEETRVGFHEVVKETLEEPLKKTLKETLEEPLKEPLKETLEEPLKTWAQVWREIKTFRHLRV